MISSDFAQILARYNQWQNRSLYGAAQALTEDQRVAGRGAFFGSIHTTLAHLLWADRVWMHRFAATAPVSADSNQGWGPNAAGGIGCASSVKRLTKSF